jgi:phage-related protein
MERAARQSALMAVSAWAKTDKEYKLELPGHPDHYLMAVCTAKPDPSTRQWWESKLRIVFTCFTNPFWTDKIEKTATCGTAFTVLGDAEPLMRIERTLSADATNQAYSLGSNVIRFSTIPTGNFVLDINNETAVVGTTSIMSNLNVWSRWIVPRTGTQTITGTGTIKYRERWQ